MEAARNGGPKKFRGVIVATPPNSDHWNVEYDDAGNAVNIKPLEKNYFKKYGLPEADIVKLVTDLSAPGVRRGPSTCGTAS